MGVGKIGKIWQARYRDVRSIKGISRGLSVSRAMVRKVLRSEATSFSYEHRTQPRPLMAALALFYSKALGRRAAPDRSPLRWMRRSPLIIAAFERA